jgi:hypothetical protein
MKIYSPSYKRSNGLKTHKLIPNVVYCIDPKEEEDYRKQGVNLQILPKGIQGNISRVRNYIKDELIKDKGLIIDDDIEAIKIWDTKNNNPYPKPIEDIEEFFEMAFNLCEESQCKLWGVNIVGDKGSYREYTPISFTNWISGSLMGFINNDCKFDERIPLKEDLDFSLQTLNKYRKLLRINYVHLIKKDHGNLGGCADYRTVAKEREQFKLFQQKWGSDIVKEDLTQKGKKKKSYDINPIIKVPIKGV